MVGECCFCPQQACDTLVSNGVAYNVCADCKGKSDERSVLADGIDARSTGGIGDSAAEESVPADDPVVAIQDHHTIRRRIIRKSDLDESGNVRTPSVFGTEASWEGEEDGYSRSELIFLAFLGSLTLVNVAAVCYAGLAFMRYVAGR